MAQHPMSAVAECLNHFQSTAPEEVAEAALCRSDVSSHARS